MTDRGQDRLYTAKTPGLSLVLSGEGLVNTSVSFPTRILTKQSSLSALTQISDESSTTEENAVARRKSKLTLALRSFQLWVCFAIAFIIALGLGLGLRAARSNGEPTPVAATPSPTQQDGPISQGMPVVMPTAMPVTTTMPAVMAPSSLPSFNQDMPVTAPSSSPFMPSTMTPSIAPSSYVAPVVTEPPVLERKRILLQSRQALRSDETVSLISHGVYLKQQNDGNLVLYRNNTTTSRGRSLDEVVVWSTGVSLDSGEYFTIIQGDGHMLTYKGTPESPGAAVWQTSSHRESTGYRLVLNEKGTGLEIHQSGIPPVTTWSSADGVLPRPPETTPIILQSGPMVGHTTHNSTKIWYLAANKSSAVEVVYKQQVAASREDGTSAGTTRNSGKTVAMPPRKEHNGSSLGKIGGLKASTTYSYQVLVDGTPVAKGEFTTAPSPRQPVKFSYLLTSCMNVRKQAGYPEQYVWDVILEKQPAFAMMNGDTVYLDPNDWDSSGVIYSRAWQRNLEQREEVYYSRFLSNIPSYMTWDDHDFGADNSYGDQRGKENSLAVVKAMWANPSYGTPSVDGVFYSYYWGDVQFFVMDDRWYRKKGWSQFGEQQLQWLYGQLLESRAVFKIIVSGGTITTYNDLKWIGQFVSKHKIHGVLFNSGDTHKNEFMSLDHAQWPYPVNQFTSSGIARENWLRPWAMMNVDTEALDPTVVVSFYAAVNEYTFSTWTHDPTMTCTDTELVQDNVRGWYNKSRCTQTVRLSDLTPQGVSDVFLESPVGGDELIAGSDHAIVWRTFRSNVETVLLQYSVDAGGEWKNITDGWIANTGNHVWTIPSEPSLRVKIRVIADTGYTNSPNDSGTRKLKNFLSVNHTISDNHATATPTSTITSEPTTTPTWTPKLPLTSAPTVPPGPITSVPTSAPTVLPGPPTTPKPSAAPNDPQPPPPTPKPTPSPTPAPTVPPPPPFISENFGLMSIKGPGHNVFTGFRGSK